MNGDHFRFRALKQFLEIIELSLTTTIEFECVKFWTLNKRLIFFLSYSKDILNAVAFFSSNESMFFFFVLFLSDQILNHRESDDEEIPKKFQKVVISSKIESFASKFYIVSYEFFEKLCDDKLKRRIIQWHINSFNWWIFEKQRQNFVEQQFDTWTVLPKAMQTFDCLDHSIDFRPISDNVHIFDLLKWTKCFKQSSHSKLLYKSNFNHLICLHSRLRLWSSPISSECKRNPSDSKFHIALMMLLYFYYLLW